MKYHSTLLFGLLFLTQSFSQKANYNPSPDNLEAREWFEDAKFGLFIHWGVYSILGDGEWVMQNQNIGIEEYNKLSTFFNPIDFDAEEWVRMAKDAGMKYITVTSRHHDGFSMFDSKVTDYDIVDRSPYGKDIMGELVEACHKNDLKIFFYYSLLDWHRDDYFPRGKTGNGIDGRKTGNWDNYIAFMKNQLTELLTNYGRIDGIWFDGEWDKPDANWHFSEIYTLIHKLQPHCLIGNNHHHAAKDGEDFQMFEKDLPGKNQTGFGTSESDVTEVLPKEVCETINNTWGFNLKDRSNKSHKELVHYLVSAAGYGANLLLNVGPMPNGKIQEDHVDALKKIGQWLRNNGSTIYETTAGPVAPTDKIVSTQKGNTIYIHVLKNDTDAVLIPELKSEIVSVKYFVNKENAPYEITSFGLVISLPEIKDEIDTIIEIEVEGE